MRDILRSLYTWAVGLTLTALGTTLLLLFLPLPGRRERGERIVRLWARSILKVAGVKVQTEGLDRLMADGAYVIVSNHQSLMDIPVCLAILPGRVRLMAKRSLFRIPVFGWVLYAEGFVPVDRHDPRKARQSLAPAERALASGERIFVFPEGTRSRTGRPGPFKSGAFRLATRTGSQIVPIAILGAEKVVAPRSKIIRPGRVRVVVGEVISTSGAADGGRLQIQRSVHRWITERVVAGR